MSTPIYGPGIYGAGDYVLASNIINPTPGGTALTFTGRGSLRTNGIPIASTVGGIGVALEASASDFTIQGELGSTVTGFQTGIVSFAPFTTVKGLTFNGILYIGALLEGVSSEFSENVVNAVGGDTSQGAYAIGVQFQADNGKARFNIFQDLYRQASAAPAQVGEGCAILFNSSMKNGVAELNHIVNSQFRPNNIGVWAGNGGPHVVQKNQIINFDVGIEGGGIAAAPLQALMNLIWRRNSTPGGAAGISADFGTAGGNAIIGYATPVTGNITISENLVD